jgi:hypothetical protein
VDYLQPQTLRSILWNSFAVYFRHWPTVLAVTAIPMIAVGLLRAFIAHVVGGNTMIFAFGIEILVNTFVVFPLTVVVSDICVGLKPSVRRAYARAFVNPGRLIGTYLALALLSFVALLALLIPGLIVTALYMFVGPVVILEQIGGRAAFTRSRHLSYGSRLRNLGIYFLVILLLIVVMFIVGGIMGLLVAVGGGEKILVEILGIILGAFLAPLFGVPIVLLYYDMRARKEGYGAPQLIEDLNY